MIDKWLDKIDQLNTKNLILWVVAISILLAAWMQYIQHGWINPDSVLYLEQARLFSLGEWEAASQIFKWPLYGACIGLTAYLTSLPIHTSAQLLNMLFFGMATASFLHLIKLSGGNSRVILMGALLLFSSQYIVGDVLEMLMRDEGFWAFYLTALVFFIRYIQSRKLSDALSWQACIIVATLFRVEAILLLILLPLFTLSSKPFNLKTSFTDLFQTYSISIIVAIVITVAILTQPQISMSQFGRLEEVFNGNLYQQFTAKLFSKSEIMSQQVLGRYLDEFAMPGLLLTFLYVMCSKTISATGLIGTGLAILSLKYSSIKIQPAKRVLIAVGIIAFISMALIIAKVFVLSSRYVVALGWIFLIFASFYLASLSINSSKKSRITFTILCIILILGFIKNILPKREGYNYAQNAVTWVRTKNISNTPIYYDDTRMVYYANAPFRGKWDNNWEVTLAAIEDGRITNHGFLLISHSKRFNERLNIIKKKLPAYVEVKRFYNFKAKKFVVIYARNKYGP